MWPVAWSVAWPMGCQLPRCHRLGSANLHMTHYPKRGVK